VTAPDADERLGEIRASASAPVRTADVGGWTDTWFCDSGVVCNIAIPYRVTVNVRAGTPWTTPDAFLAHLLDAYPHEGVWLEVVSDAASGSGLGTSAALAVAAVAALSSMSGMTPTRDEIAVRAHQLEVESGRQSGVQDHWAAAHGGVSLLQVSYPRCDRREVAIAAHTREVLAARLHTVCFAHAHSSTDLHLGVIERVQQGFGASALDSIRGAAADAAKSLEAGDLIRFGRSLTSNHEAIRRLDSRLVSAEADQVVELAAGIGALGWKVNGAGGAGGSMVVLGPLDEDADHCLSMALAALPGVHVLSGAIDDRGVHCDATSPASTVDVAR
jgi:D-glycero-alpha-D-manno-heptose-7-phosphate kinase